MHILLTILFPLLFLTSCYEKDFSTPAQKQIDEYRQIGRMCMAQKKPNQAENANTKTEEHKPEEVEAPQIDTSTMFMIQKDDIVLGNPLAKVVVFEYSAPTCTHCAYFHKTFLPTLKAKYIDTNKIAYVIRSFISNKQDLDAAILTRCVPQEQFLKMITILYAQQESWAFNAKYREILTNIGQLSGLTPEQYNTCIANTEFADFLINNTRAIAHLPKFMGTPSFVIDGQLLETAYTLENLSKAIDQAIIKNEKSEN
jgi:protein-disulfide isomerase